MVICLPPNVGKNESINYLLPPVIPSIDLVKNNTSNGRVITKVPKKVELMLKRFSLGKNSVSG
jgi:hypothetical protein